MADQPQFDPFAAAGLVAEAQPPQSAQTPSPDAAPPAAQLPASPKAAELLSDHHNPHGPEVDRIGNLSFDAQGTPFYNTPPAQSAAPANAPGTKIDALVDQVIADGQPTPTAGKTAPTPEPPATAVKGPAFDPFAAAGLVPDTSAGATETQPKPSTPPPPKPPGLAESIQQVGGPDWLVSAAHKLDAINDYSKGFQDQATHTLSFGLDDEVKPVIMAAVNTLAREANGQPSDFAGDFAKAQQNIRAQRAQFSATNPVSSGAASLTGAAVVPVGGLFKTAAEGAPLAARALTAAQNTAAGAGLGAVQGFGEAQGGLDARLQAAKQGAEFGGGLSAAAPVVASVAVPAVRAVGQAVESAAALPGRLLSSGAQEQSVANQLRGMVDPAQIQTSPVGPLDLAQATNDANVAAKVDYAKGLPAAQNDAAALKKAQGEAIRTQLGKVGAVKELPAASQDVVNTVRQARGVAGAEENRLWNKPELAATPVTPDAVQASVKSAIGDLDPVLADSMAPELKALVNRLNRAGPTTVQDLNGIRSKLEKFARETGDASQRGMARTLSNAFLDGMDRIPEIAGRPAAPSGMVRLEEGASKGNIIPESQAFGRQVTPVMTPEIQPNPDIAAAYQEARDYTRKMRTLFDSNGDVGKLLATAKGQYRQDPSEGARVFFNFGNGSPEGPQTIAQLSDFIDNLKNQPGAGSVAQKLKDDAASYIVSYISRAARTGENEAIRPAALQDLLRNNMTWLDNSGVLSKAQSQAASDLLDYVDMLRRPELLRTQVGPHTNARFETGKSFVQQIMNPLLRRVLEASGSIAAGEHFGGVAGVGATAASFALEHAVANAEAAMRAMMAGAMLDSRVAASLAAKGRAPSAPLTPAVRAMLSTMPKSVLSQLSGVIGAQKTTEPQGSQQ